MDTSKLKKFAQYARRSLIEQVSNKLKLVLAKDSAARRESAMVVAKLEKQIQTHGKEQVIEKVAYIWFNRFCALRFMDVNRYTRIGVVSPAEGQIQPEILADAKMGHIDESMVNDAVRQKIFSLLDGKIPSQDPQAEAYRLLVVAICNYWHGPMPFMFEQIADYTELLMPDDLLSDNSILSLTREAMTPETCEDVEVIGWLYQFYISEKKDEVFEGLKKNKKITPENIPAATQLFTPHWIVRYLVENSLGRLWMLNHPDSKLIEQMDYYIKPAQPESDFLHISSPEEIKICDPACGSGHMLTYAFDLLYAIYEEEGYEPAEIPEKILTQNLYGIEIDERAGELAAFALTMKARAKQRRFFRKQVQPNICVLENVRFGVDELKEYMDFIGRDLFTTPLQTTLSQFEEADNFGSLIRPELTDVEEIVKVLEARDVSEQLFLKAMHDNVLKALRQADYLSPKYHVVIANPPYMGSKGMNGRLAAWAKLNYKNSRADLFSMFIKRNLSLTQNGGTVAMITMQGWMFLSTYVKLRNALLHQNTILSMAHLGARAFDSIGGEVVATTAFVLKNICNQEFKGAYLRLVNGSSESEKEKAILEAVGNPTCAWRYLVSAMDIMTIPGYPIAYWASESILRLFSEGKSITEFVNSRDGLTTGNNEIFIRYHWEIARESIEFGAETPAKFWQTRKRFAPLIKGGSYRKWYGNLRNVITYDEKSYKILAESGNKLPSREYYFRENLNWTRISSPSGSFRYTPYGCIFESASLCAYSRDQSNLRFALAAANSCIAIPQLDLVNPTTNLLSGYFDMLRVPQSAIVHVKEISSVAKHLVAEAKSDWDSYESSWDFTSLPLLNFHNHQPTLKAAYQNLYEHWQEMTLEMQRLEQENNRIFIEAYGLQDELTPEVPLNEITLTCNPHYRYKGDKSEEELEALLLADTMKEFISYAVGCMFGRYALDKPGLILANQGETIDDYLKQIPEPVFPADDDNVIPMLDGNWFTDDITERFYKFLRVTFGEEHYEENLEFIEQAIGKNIRKYFLKDFYTDHVKRYKKRPIYWLFSSPKGSFNALIYMHRYRPDTVSVVLNNYLRDFQAKLTSRKDHLEAVSISASATSGEKTRALKEIDKINKMNAEMEEYERDVLYPLATKQVEIDLDDGVKVNYNKFGKALKKIPGLSR